MYAAVPFYNLPKLHGALAHDLPEPLRGFLQGVRRILQIQRQQRRDPGYTFIPEFPEGAAAPRLSSG